MPTRAVPYVALGLAAILLVPCAAAQLKHPDLASRPLTDADMEKYVAILTEVRKVQKTLKNPSSPEGLSALRAATAKAAEPHDWGTTDYAVVDSRMKVAEQHVKMEKSVPVPAEKKADVDLFRKWQPKILAARK
jgi:hypothetical protein